MKGACALGEGGAGSGQGAPVGCGGPRGRTRPGVGRGWGASGGAAGAGGPEQPRDSLRQPGVAGAPVGEASGGAVLEKQRSELFPFPCVPRGTRGGQTAAVWGGRGVSP